MTAKPRPAYLTEHKRWPFGKETTACPICQGTGIDPEKVREYVRSRTTDEDPWLLVGCRHCERRGRVIVETPAQQPQQLLVE